MKVCAIVVTYNGMKWIEECLNSLLNSSIPVTIIVIDNSSTDSTCDYITDNFETVILLAQKENLGFGKANNIGMSYALKEQADYVFLLNQDAFVTADTIANLIKSSQSNGAYGILSPIQLDYSGKVLENYFFRFMAKDQSRTFYSDFVLKNKIEEIYDIDFVQAASWLLPIATIKKIGGFDPVFFHYGEDVNYCQRTLFHDLKIGVVSNVFIRHVATIHDVKVINKFSEKYFKTYVKNLTTSYANINIPFNDSFALKEIKSFYFHISINLLRCNFKNVKGFYKKLSIFKSTIKQIKISRKTNQIIKAHYLDV